MNPDLRNTIIDRLKRSEYWTTKTREGKDNIQGLTCPECEKIGEAWAYLERPFSINCNRKNKCGVTVKTLELFPEVIQRMERDYPATEADPIRPARTYLESRGIDPGGLTFEYWRNVRKTGSGAVMFPVTRPDGGTSWNGRIFNPSKGKDKAHNRGSTSGAFWRHPGKTYDSSAETFITEGIINALSLIQMGFQAISVISSGQDPGAVDLSEFHDLVLAFDNDDGGHKGLKSWKAAHPKAGAVMPHRGRDWNDLLLQWGPKAADEFGKDRERLEFNAKLALCESAEDYAKAWETFNGRPPGLFDFDGRLFYAGEKGVSMVGEFTLDVDHYQRIETNPDAMEYRYRLNVRPYQGRECKFTVTAAEIASNQRLTTTLLQRARTLWTGGDVATNALLRKVTKSPAPVIRQLDRIGHDRETGCYVFQKFMIDPRGQIINLEDGRDYFRMGRRFLRPARMGGEEIIHPAESISPRELYRLMVCAWADRAAVAIAWMIASWFVAEVKTYANGFPALSLFGDPQVGKSVITRRMSNCQGFGGEGVPMTGSTTKSFNRLLSKRAGLFLAFLEESQSRRSKFNYDVLLNTYTNDELEHRAAFSNDNQTQTLEFHGTIMFVQNVEPFTTRAQRERVISLEFRRSQLNEFTEKNFEKLIRIPPEAFAWFYPFIMKQHPQIREGWAAEYERAKNDLMEGIPDPRIRSNHAIVLAFHRILCELLGFQNEDLVPFLEEIGRRKIEACQTSENPIADLFFEAVMEDIKSGRADSYAHIQEDKGRLYVRMPVAGGAIGGKMNIGTKDIVDAVKTHPAFKRNGLSHRFPGEDEAKKSWEFDMTLIGCCGTPESESAKL